MQAILDTHLHLYPEYDIEKAFQFFLNRTHCDDAQILKIACLAERHDCHYFDALANGKKILNNYEIEIVSDKELKVSSKDGNDYFHLLAGRQVISAENIEVLALCCDQDIADGLNAEDIIAQCKQKDAAPVVAWSPGKWFTKRGKLVQSLLDNYSPSDFLLGDTSLRPIGWGIPWLMRRAKTKGFRVVAGSDPLPFNGEESWFGAYCSHVNSQKTLSAVSLLKEIQSASSNISINNKGKRSDPLTLLKRLRNNAKSKD